VWDITLFKESKEYRPLFDQGEPSTRLFSTALRAWIGIHKVT